MTLAVFDPWVALAKQWQPLLAGLLGVLASIILAAAIIRAAKINAAKSANYVERPDRHDLRTAPAPAKVEAGTIDSVNVNLEKLRSLLRSALSALSSTDANDETARSLCARIAAFPWNQCPLPADADGRVRETNAGLLSQFEILQAAMDKQWSAPEASAILIQLNANARALSTMLKQMEAGETEARGQQKSS